MKLIQLVSNDDVNSTPTETINSIKNAGFDGVFIQWYDGDYKKFDLSEDEQVKLCNNLNLEIEFAHLGYFTINDLWLNDNDAIIEKFKKQLDEIKQNNITLAIMHLSKTSNPPMYNLDGIRKLKIVCDYAKNLGITIAFENTRIKGYLEFVFDNLDCENIGVCFDSGHYHCYFKDDFNFEKFKGKIIAVHLHDNYGENDEHLLPFDGTNNWDKIVKNLVKCGYKGPITLESSYSKHYEEMDRDYFYKKSYEVAKKIEQLFIKYQSEIKGE